MSHLLIVVISPRHGFYLEPVGDRPRETASEYEFAVSVARVSAGCLVCCSFSGADTRKQNERVSESSTRLFFFLR